MKMPIVPLSDAVVQVPGVELHHDTDIGAPAPPVLTGEMQCLLGVAFAHT